MFVPFPSSPSETFFKNGERISGEGITGEGITGEGKTGEGKLVAWLQSLASSGILGNPLTYQLCCVHSNCQFWTDKVCFDPLLFIPQI